MDRAAGKMWSWRLQDDFSARLARRGSRIEYFFNRDGKGPSIVHVLDEDVSVDDILVFMLQIPGLNGGGASHEQFEVSDNDYEPWLSSITLGPEESYDRFLTIYSVQGLERNWSRMLVHEIGHMLGYSGTAGSGHVPSFERYINRASHTFVGPRSMEEHSGRPIPFQWLDDQGNPVPPQTLGAAVDYGHPGICSSVMSYCFFGPDNEGEVVGLPSELDFAVLADIGWDTLDSTTASEPEVYGWGAWGRYSAWGVGVERTINYTNVDVAVHVQDLLRAGSDAFGIAPSANLADSPALTGTATWSGSLLGVDLGQKMLPPVSGNAELQVDLESLRGTARFDDLTVFVENESVPFRRSSVNYGISVNGNAFSDADSHLGGAFYGPKHEEMAGVLNDRRPHVNLLAGFGGKR